MTVIGVVLMTALAVAAAFCGARIVRGPTGFDRAVAFECLTLECVGALTLVSMLLRTDAFIDLVLVVALLGFLVTMAFAAYLEGTLVE